MPTPRNPNGLTLRQELFVKHFLANGFTPGAAAAAAGYSAKTAPVIAARLLENPKVNALIEKGKNKLFDKYDVTADRVVREMACLGFSNMEDYVTVDSEGDIHHDFSKLTREQAAAIVQLDTEEYTEGRGEDAREVKRTRLRLADKKGPLELLGRHVGVFEEDKKDREIQVHVSYDGNGAGKIAIGVKR